MSIPLSCSCIKMQIHTFDDYFLKCTFIKDIGHSMTMNLKPLEMPISYSNIKRTKMQK